MEVEQDTHTKKLTIENLSWLKIIIFLYIYINYYFFLITNSRAGAHRVVVSTAAFHARVRGSVPGLGGLKETKKCFFPHPRVKVSIAGSLRDQEVACSASDRQDSNFESCVWRKVSSHSSHHPQEVLLAQFSLYVHKGGLKPDSFLFIYKQLFGHKVDFLCVNNTNAMMYGLVYNWIITTLPKPRYEDMINMLLHKNHLLHIIQCLPI